MDTLALEKQFYRLSRKLHPDLYARASAEEQGWSLEKSSVLNDAWRTLREPLARTEYLLGLLGIRLEEQSRDAAIEAAASGTDKQQVVPPDLLEEVFELNMQLEEMRMAKAGGADDPELRGNLEAARKNFDQQLKASEQDLQRLWAEWDSRGGGKRRRDAASCATENGRPAQSPQLHSQSAARCGRGAEKLANDISGNGMNQAWLTNV